MKLLDISKKFDIIINTHFLCMKFQVQYNILQC